MADYDEDIHSTIKDLSIIISDIRTYHTKYAACSFLLEKRPEDSMELSSYLHRERRNARDGLTHSLRKAKLRLEQLFHEYPD